MCLAIPLTIEKIEGNTAIAGAHGISLLRRKWGSGRHPDHLHSHRCADLYSLCDHRQQTADGGISRKIRKTPCVPSW